MYQFQDLLLSFVVVLAALVVDGGGAMTERIEVALPVFYHSFA